MYIFQYSDINYKKYNVQKIFSYECSFILLTCYIFNINFIYTNTHLTYILMRLILVYNYFLLSMYNKNSTGRIN